MFDAPSTCTEILNGSWKLLMRSHAVVTGLEVSSRSIVWCKRMSRNFTAIGEVLGTRPKIMEILEVSRKSFVEKNCMLLTLRLGLCQCLVLS